MPPIYERHVVESRSPSEEKLPKLLEPLLDAKLREFGHKLTSQVDASVKDILLQHLLSTGIGGTTARDTASVNADATKSAGAKSESETTRSHEETQMLRADVKRMSESMDDLQTSVADIKVVACTQLVMHCIVRSLCLCLVS